MFKSTVRLKRMYIAGVSDLQGSSQWYSIRTTYAYVSGLNCFAPKIMCCETLVVRHSLRCMSNFKHLSDNKSFVA